MSIERKPNILYVSIHFTGDSFLGFGRYCDKVFPELAALHLSERLREGYLLLFFIIKFVSSSSFLRLYHFYSLFTAYFLYEEEMSVRLYGTQKETLTPSQKQKKEKDVRVFVTLHWFRNN